MTVRKQNRGTWLGKNRKPRRTVSKEEKADEKNTNRDVQRDAVVICPAGQCKSVKEQKGSQGTQDKYADIQNKNIFSPKTGIRIEQNRNEGSPGQNSETAGRNDTGIIFFQVPDHEEGI